MKRAPLKRRKPLNRVSNKRAAQNRVYAKLRRQFLIVNPYCRVMFEISRKYFRATEIHHKNHRTGERLNDTKYWMAVSREGHTYLHSNPAEAYARGWLIRK